MINLLIAGVAVGAIYALIALGFVVIYKATGVINFAHGAIMGVGAYLVFDLRTGLGLSLPIGLLLGVAMAIPAARYLVARLQRRVEVPERGAAILATAMLAAPLTVFLTAEVEGLGFWTRLGLACVLTAYVGIAFEFAVLRRMVGQPMFAIVMVTIGLEIALRIGLEVRYGSPEVSLAAPFTGQVEFLGATVSAGRFWVVGVAALALVAFFLFFRFTDAGIAMRATAVDQEAARMVGVSARQVFASSWAIAAILATVAGALLVSAFPGASLAPPVVFVALRAFPAAIVGGLDSTGGAVVGGLLIGVVELLVAGYQPSLLPWLGEGFHEVAAYLVMILVLLVRPHGLFGSPEIERV